MTKRWRTAIIGFGKIAAGLQADPLMAARFGKATHAAVLRDHPAFDWGAVVDPDPEARRRAQRDFGIGLVVSRPEDLAGYAPEVLVLAGPPGTRLGALRALPSAVGVMVEKPLGATLAEAEAFTGLCRSRSLVVQVHYWRRAVPALCELAGGSLTEFLGSVQVAFGVYGNGWRNNGSHLVDFLRMMIGDVAWVSASAKISVEGLPLPADFQLTATLGHRNGALSHIAPIDFRYYREISLDLWGQRGRLQIVNESLTLVGHARGPNRALTSEAEIESKAYRLDDINVQDVLPRLYDNLAKALDGKAALLSGLVSAIESHRVIEAAEESFDFKGACVVLSS